MSQVHKDHIRQALVPFLVSDVLDIVLQYSARRIEGKLMAEFRSSHMEHPNGIAVDGDILYVASTGSKEVIAFDIHSGRVIRNIDCSQVYHGCAGPDDVHVAGNLLFVGGHSDFHFFTESRGIMFEAHIWKERRVILTDSL